MIKTDLNAAKIIMHYLRAQTKLGLVYSFYKSKGDLTMLDDIYPRLFLEVIPSTLKKNSPYIKSFLNRRENGSLSSNYGKLIHEVYKHDPNSNIGLEFGKHLRPAALCDISRVMMTADNINSAFEIVKNVQHTHKACYFPSMRQKSDVYSLSLTFPFKSTVSSTQRRFCTEAVYSFMVNTMKTITNNQFTPIRARFDFPEPKYKEEYSAIFGNDITFNSPLNLIEFDERYLDVCLSSYNPMLNQLYQNKCIDEWQNNERSYDNFEHAVITRMMKNHPETFDCGTLADAMNLSIRGLQKKFTKNETSFSQLSTRVRKELTKVYLIQEQRSIDWTAEKLGFKSRSGFSRFFKVEFNLTPTEFVNMSNAA